MSVITRFAPSPTGMLHIGGVRTALMNFVFARRHGGKYLLRIEDTDQKRSSPEAKTAIIEGLSWLGLSGDGETVYQSTRLERHQELAQKLLSEGKAYFCDCTPEELQTIREVAHKEGRTRVYDRRSRDKNLSSGVVRIKMPTEGETILNDAIQGEVRIQNDHLDDYILLRADGSPTYMLSCVVDDLDMGVTHIIRGDDHLVNAFRQYHLILAMDCPAPQYAHLALLHGDDGAKLSKRHGALGIESYQRSGYLAEAINNYLLRLGWGKGEEMISLDAAAQIFRLEDINKAPSRLDFARLDYFNAHYLREMAANAPEELAIRCASFANVGLNTEDTEKLGKAMSGLSSRVERLDTLWQSAQFYLHAPSWPLAEEKTRQQFLKKYPEADFPTLIHTMQGWDFSDKTLIQQALEAQVEKLGVGFGKVGQPLRIALAGSPKAPEINEILWVLGKDEAIKRIDKACIWATNQAV